MYTSARLRVNEIIGSVHAIIRLVDGFTLSRFKRITMTHQGIWMAEDDPDDRLLYQEVLQTIRPNGPFVFFLNGKTLWAELINPDTQLPALLIVDGLMPFLNGWDIIDNMSLSERFSDVYTVLLTGHRSSRSQTAGVRQSIRVEQKPFRLTEVEKLFRELLQQSDAPKA